MQQQIQIPKTLFATLCRYHLLGETDDRTTKAIYDGLTAKLDAAVKRELYTTYKTAASAADREAARQEYLRQAGILDSFKS